MYCTWMHVFFLIFCQLLCTFTDFVSSQGHLDKDQCRCLHLYLCGPVLAEAVRHVWGQIVASCPPIPPSHAWLGVWECVIRYHASSRTCEDRESDSKGAGRDNEDGETKAMTIYNALLCYVLQRSVQIESLDLLQQAETKDIQPTQELGLSV